MLIPKNLESRRGGIAVLLLSKPTLKSANMY
jgi:hypothetical protein